jgi:hypothetical protein
MWTASAVLKKNINFATEIKTKPKEYEKEHFNIIILLCNVII